MGKKRFKFLVLAIIVGLISIGFIIRYAESTKDIKSHIIVTNYELSAGDTIGKFDLKTIKVLKKNEGTSLNKEELLVGKVLKYNIPEGSRVYSEDIVQGDMLGDNTFSIEVNKFNDIILGRLIPGNEYSMIFYNSGVYFNTIKVKYNYMVTEQQLQEESAIEGNLNYKYIILQTDTYEEALEAIVNGSKYEYTFIRPEEGVLIDYVYTNRLETYVDEEQGEEIQQGVTIPEVAPVDSTDKEGGVH